MRSRGLHSLSLPLLPLFLETEGHAVKLMTRSCGAVTVSQERRVACTDASGKEDDDEFTHFSCLEADSFSHSLCLLPKPGISLSFLSLLM